MLELAACVRVGRYLQLLREDSSVARLGRVGIELLALLRSHQRMTCQFCCDVIDVLAYSPVLVNDSNVVPDINLDEQAHKRIGPSIVDSQIYRVTRVVLEIGNVDLL